MMSLFKLADDKQSILLTALPGDDDFPVSFQQLKSGFEHSDYAECWFDEESAKKLYAAKLPAPAKIVIGRRCSASLEIKIDETLMVAEAWLTTAQGGDLLSMDEAKRLLVQAGIKRGVSIQRLEEFLSKQFIAKAGSTHHCVIAQGRRPKEGQDARFEKLCLTARDRILTPQVRDDGKADMRDLGAMITAKPGDPLMRRTPATKGDEGFNVCGDVILPIPGADLQLNIADGSAISPDDPNLLIATKVGLPILVDRGVRVDDVVILDQVSAGTGHVNFEGSVIITGDVGPGMKVEAQGDITVQGFVESATLTAKGDITIVNGAIGQLKDDGLTTRIRCGGGFYAGYAQYCAIDSINSVIIENQSLHNELNSAADIQIGRGKKPMGKLIGGKAIAKLGLVAGEIGVPAGSKAEIVLAAAWQELDSKRIELDKQYQQIKLQRVDLDAAERNIQMLKDEEKKRAYLQKLAATYQHALEQEMELEEQLVKVQSALEGLVKDAQLKVNKILHPGIELTIANVNFRSNRPYNACRLTLGERKIEIDFPT